MSNIQNLYISFLKDAGRDEKTKMGNPHLDKIKAESTQKLIDNLIKEGKFNRLLILVITCMFVTIFSLGIFFAIYYRDSPKTMGILFGGTFLSLLGIIKGLQDLWKQKSTLDILLTLVPNVPPDQTVVIIETLLYGKREKVT